MSTDNAENLFFEPFFNFSITKPSTWDFLPPAWSPVAQMKEDPVPHEIALRANLPFVCIRQSHDSPVRPYPTVQITARPTAGIPGDEEAQGLLDKTVELMAEHYQDFELLEASIDEVVAGYRTSLIRSRAVVFGGEDEDIEMGIISRAHVIFSPSTAFSVGMTSSDDPDYYRESDFQQMRDSIEIGLSVQ